jgi:hypothetical protein
MKGNVLINELTYIDNQTNGVTGPAAVSASLSSAMQDTNATATCQ